MATKKKSLAKSKRKSSAWFIPVRGSYLPNNIKGWLTYVPYVGYLVFTLVATPQVTGSAAKTILLIIPNWVAATIVMTWIAKQTS